MGEVSANPSAMRDYYLDGNAQTAGWQPEVDRLRDVLDNLWKAFTDGNVPPEYRAGITAQTAETLPDECEQAKDTVQHVDRYVYDVAEAVAEADGFDISTNPAGEVSWPDTVLTVPESALDGTGPASLDEHLELQAGEDAAALLDLMGDEAAWSAGYATTDSLEEILPLLEGISEEIDDPAYAAEFYDALGAGGIQDLTAVIDSLVLHDGHRTTILDVTDTFSTGFAHATHTIPPETLDQLLADGPGTLPYLLLARGDLYQSEWLGQAALAYYDPDLIGFARDYDGAGQQIDRDQIIVMRALAENPGAAWVFAEHDDQLLTLTDPPAITATDDTLSFRFGGSHSDTQLTYEAWAAATYMHATGIPITYPDTYWEDLRTSSLAYASFLTDFIPVASEWKAAVETGDGIDPITGEELSGLDRSITGGTLAAGLFLPFIPANAPRRVVRILRNMFRPGRRALDPGAPRRTPNPPVQTSDIKSIVRLDYGNEAYVLTTDDGVYLYKPWTFDAHAAGVRPENEVGAYVLDQHLGFDLVPETQFFSIDGNTTALTNSDPVTEFDTSQTFSQVERELFNIPNGELPGTLQRWDGAPIDGAMVDGTLIDPAHIDMSNMDHLNGLSFEYEELERLAVFDYIAGNSDRHGMNFISGSDGELRAIDHGYSFPDTPHSPEYADHAFEGVELSQATMDSIRNIDLDALEDSLLQAGLSETAVQGAIGRINDLLDTRSIPQI